MKRTTLALMTAALLLTGLCQADAKDKKVPDVLKFTVKSIDGKAVKLSKYQGKVILVVNVASNCGFTPQYSELQKLHKKYGSKGLAILGFPCNQFGRQEPGSEAEIKKFCESKYNVEFDMFSKVDVKGSKQSDLYAYLTKNSKKTGNVRWNFEKFLIGRDGKIIGRYKSGIAPNSKTLIGAVEGALAKK
ncbi:MAG: glutathione peroxidase [Planctomycetota bacterium]|nr:glutathione peroxidase [Planctomycetota bacterium]